MLQPARGRLLGRRVRFVVLAALAAAAVPLPAQEASGKADRANEIMRTLREGLVSRQTERVVSGLELNAGQVARFGKLEASFEVRASWQNPYDPEDIRVDGVITAPSGKTFTVPAFYYESWEPQNGLTQMMPANYKRLETAKPWRLRFAPGETGTYRLRIRVADGDGKAFESAETTFTSVDGEHTGFIRISEGNPRSFEVSGTGASWWGCGVNVPWIRPKNPGEPSYEHYFGRADGKMNATRLWLCHWSWLEWTCADPNATTSWKGYGGLGYYNQQIACTVDRVFELAEAHGLRIMLCTEDNNEQFKDGTDSGWVANPYNAVNGGPCAEPNDIFTNADARRHYRDRMRYIIARWGYSTSLWAVNSWNDCNAPAEDVLSWLREMSGYIHSLAAGWRPLIYGTNYKFEANLIADYVQPEGDFPTDRPAVVQECYNVTDPLSAFKPQLRDTLWREMARGMAAVMVWPHVAVEQTDAWGVFTAPIAFAESLRMNEGRWQPARVHLVSAECPGRKTFDRLVTAVYYGDVPVWGQPSSRDEFPIAMDTANQWLEGISPKLYGMRRKEWRKPHHFIVDLPRPGQLLVEVIEYGEKPQELVISVDGKPVASYVFTGGRRYTKGEERWKTAEIPAGHHTVTVENRGDDWISVRRYGFSYPSSQPADLVDATGQSCADRGFAYFSNLSSDLVYQEVIGKKAAALQAVVARVEGVEPGRYTVERVDTHSGGVIDSREVEAGADGLVVTLGELTSDAAIRWRRLSATADDRSAASQAVVATTAPEKK